MELTQIIYIIAAFMVVIGTASYYFGQRKSEKPMLAALMGTVFSIVPIVGIIYLAILINKPDVNQK